MDMKHSGDPVSEYLDAFYNILREMERKMTSAGMTGSISHDFIVQMIPHHRAAVEMCENLLRFDPGESLADLARTIIRQQTQGIAEMEALLCPCGRVCNSPQEVCRYRQRERQALDTMFCDMAHAGGVGVEQSFLREMIPHHEGAVRMSENALRHCLCQPLRPILENIITVQKQEIGEMRRMLAEMD